MKTPRSDRVPGCHHCLCPLPAAVFLFVSFIGLHFVVRAATGPTSTIRGTVSNAATASNLNHASVQIVGLPHEYLTERDGSYAIIGLAPRTYQVTVNYTGFDSQKNLADLKLPFIERN